MTVRQPISDLFTLWRNSDMLQWHALIGCRQLYHWAQQNTWIFSNIKMFAHSVLLSFTSYRITMLMGWGHPTTLFLIAVLFVLLNLPIILFMPNELNELSDLYELNVRSKCNWCNECNERNDCIECNESNGCNERMDLVLSKLILVLVYLPVAPSLAIHFF